MSKIYFYNEDCQKTIYKMNDKNYKVDLVITSPPYNTNVKATKSSGNKAVRDSSHDTRYDVYFDKLTNDEYCNWIVDIFKGFEKSLNENGCILFNVSYGNENPEVMWQLIGEILDKTEFIVADTIIWKKKNALPNTKSSNKLTRITEFVIVFCRRSEFKTFKMNKEVSRVKENGQKYYKNYFNYIEAKNNDGPNEFNKATFSSELIIKLLELYGYENCVVYDPFMGTGTTALGVEMFDKNNTMTCIGSEISENQVEFSKQRIDEYRNPDKYKKEIVNE